MLKKSLFLFVVVSAISYANVTNESNDTKDKFLPADNSNALSLKSKNREGYMPNITTPEYAKSGIYAGLGLGANSLKFSDSSNTIITLSLVAGYTFNQYLAAESRATIGVSNSKSIDYKNMSLFVKPKYEVMSGLDIYSLVGVGKTSANSINGDDTKASKATMQLGVGAGYKLENNFKIFADYTYLGKNTNAKYKNAPSTLKSGSLTAGVTYDF